MINETQTPLYTVVPVPLLDSTTGLTDIVARLSLCFQERLDVEKLRKAWYKVSSAWPILNARVRESSESPSGLAYHVPTPAGMVQLESDPDHRKRQFFALNMSTRSMDEFSPSAKRLMSEHDSIRVQPAPSDSASDFYAGQNAPKTFQDTLQSSVGVLTVQATTFRDGTVLSMSMLHVLGDGFCIKDILEAWTSALKGGTPKPMYDFGMDIFAPYAPGGALSSLSAEEVKLGKDPPPPQGYYVYNWRDKASFLMRYWYDSHFTAPETDMEARCICIPHHIVAKLQQEAANDLKDEPEASVGKSDVLYAWLLKRCFAGFAQSRQVNPLTIVNLRGRTPDTRVENKDTGRSSAAPKWPKHDFINAALPTPLGDLQVQEIRNMPLGRLALQIRRKVASGADSENARALLAFTLHHGLWKNRTTNKVAMFSRPESTWLALTDWRALKFASFDWSGALPNSTHSEPNIPVRPSMLHSTMRTPFSRRQRFALMGEVKSGVLLGGILAKRQWKDVDHGFGAYIGAEGKYDATSPVSARL
ncbi:hypothetical protein BCV69DRAFT_285165 [Microstroma glucosiphilum]|uniref:Uncharacterized protein n=1 Tax=Pseudomicrostroma glucosiphilum TaxID=1684307 RepID=A0A316U290_9BASI|nr:hypothetical protein BCV69DRAFT_285165 [Pseudomicrostroma glucosiphilum]PWN18543.1 hypothetical protein BCV69DRAFT_285165 [Pseudomicrostroma glucosiphilum]